MRTIACLLRGIIEALVGATPPNSGGDAILLEDGGFLQDENDDNLLQD